VDADSVGSLPISRIAGAFSTSRIEAVLSGLAMKRRRQGREVGRPVMIDVIRLEDNAGKF
jgi:hypothetical protein